MIEIVLSGFLRWIADDWSEAILAEARELPAGRARNRWLWGGVTTMVKEAPMSGLRTVRFGAIAGVAAAGALTASILLRYPHAAAGAGGPIYTALLAIALTTYMVVAWVLTTGAAPATRGKALRVGTLAGLAAAAVLTAGFQLPIAPSGLLVLATAAAPLLATIAVPRIETGLWTGMTAALLNLVATMALTLAFPSHVPLDEDVLRNNHTAADILAANIGERLVGPIGFLVMGPLLGLLFGFLGVALAQRWRSTQTGS
jgi:hypothetical protein